MTALGQLRVFAERVAVKPNYSVTYIREVTPRLSACNRPSSNTANGILSDKAVKRIKVAASWLQFLSRGMLVYSRQLRRHTKCKLVFITLTLPSSGNKSDKFIVAHCLQPMLKWLQRSHGCYLYIYKVEVQEERYYRTGERVIHFHITTNRFVHHSKVRNKWNAILRNNNLLNLHESPPSTEIRGVYNEKGFASYLAKYISKKVTDPALVVNCKVWGCSHALSNINVTLGQDTHNDYYNTRDEFISTTSKGSKQLKHCTVHYTSLNNKKKIPLELKNEINNVTDTILKKYSSFAPSVRLKLL